MREDDGRRLGHRTLEELRFRAVRWVEEGVRPADVAERLGLRRSTVYGWLAAYREGGPDALRARPVPGRPPKLTWDGVREVLAGLAGRGPRDAGLPDGELWTRPALCALLERDLGVRISPVTLTRLLDRAGLTAARPLGAAGLPPAVARWRAERLPVLRATVRAEGGTLYFLAASAETTAPDGQARLGLLSAAPGKGATRFLLVEGEAPAPAAAGFCARLVLDAPGPVTLVLSTPPPDRTASLTALAAGTGGELRLAHLPGVTPW
ncbi:helix-turn-helix domain-containing protein [Actinomadura parmotrematis]|uniref:Helix-turn-helix domain-containing protein n=1 Tax=Actinomadura parmotrematis TaxID=2864039 RepID=A0ABS7G270_9ACTN|nr:helix-turn-helix domain-containing protein [Actinomadura parmotrematis]MBW8486816.1 helix-turn-helix domain-containing protein [Actinomadura parmotrematis]